MKAITAAKGQRHIYPYMDAMWHRALMGRETCVFERHEQFAAEIITNNEIRIRSGIGALQGRFFCVDPNTYDSVTIANGTLDENRIDLIVARWTVDASAGIEACQWTVLQGASTTGTPVAPTPTEGTLDNGDTVVDMAFYEVSIEGINVTDITPLFETMAGIYDLTVTPLADEEIDAICV